MPAVPVNSAVISKKPLVQSILHVVSYNGLHFVDSHGEARLVHVTRVHFLQLLCLHDIKVLWNLSSTKAHAV